MSKQGLGGAQGYCPPPTTPLRGFKCEDNLISFFLKIDNFLLWIFADLCICDNEGNSQNYKFSSEKNCYFFLI